MIDKGELAFISLRDISFDVIVVGVNTHGGSLFDVQGIASDLRRQDVGITSTEMKTGIPAPLTNSASVPCREEITERRLQNVLERTIGTHACDSVGMTFCFLDHLKQLLLFITKESLFYDLRCSFFAIITFVIFFIMMGYFKLCSVQYHA